MTLSRRRFSFALASSAAALGTPALRAQPSNRIVLGQSAPFTGAAAQLGIQFNKGAQLFFAQINAQGGVLGKQLDLLPLDDGYEPDRCAANTRQLIEQDVFGLFGYIGTPTSLAALPLVKEARIPFFAPFTGAMSLREPMNKWVFHVRASYHDETALIVKHKKNLGLKKVAVFYQNDAYGKAGLDGVNAALAADGSKPVALATVERNSVDVAAAVKTIIAAAPDGIVQVSAYKSCAAFIREARKAGYGGTFYNVSFVGTQALADDLGRDGAGVVVSQVMPSPYSAAKPIAREFIDAVKKGGADYSANFSSMEGYVAAKVFAEGLRRGAKATREGFVAGVESIGAINLGGFGIALSATDHVASSFVELSMLTGDGRVRT